MVNAEALANNRNRDVYKTCIIYRPRGDRAVCHRCTKPNAVLITLVTVRYV